MSTGYSLRFYTLRITLQILALGYLDPPSAMADTRFVPYVSEFEYASRFHPSRNPDCSNEWSGSPNERDERTNRRNFGSSRSERSPEEGPPVGQESSIEVRAILVRCPETEQELDDVLINRNIYNITAGRSRDILDFHGFDSDEPARQSEVRGCRRKLVITMKFNNIGKTKTQEEFVVIDHVLDPVTMHKARLLNPFVVKVRQEPVLQLYGLKFHGVVNAEAREEVINNKQSNYTGCDDTSENPTCGRMFFEDRPIPYSQGFCCSCDPEVNLQRQTSAMNLSIPSSRPNSFRNNKDRSIRPFKSPRSVRANFLDELLNPGEIPKAFEDNALESFEDYFPLERFDPMADSSGLMKNSHKTEKDLMSLKNAKKTNVRTSNSMLKSEDIKNRNRIGSYEFSRPIAPSLVKDLSARTNEKSDDNADDRENIDRSNEGNESPGKVGQQLSRHRSAKTIIDELAKLEEDYEKIRTSSIKRVGEKNNETLDDRRLKFDRATSENVKYSDRVSNLDEGSKFRPIESFEKQENNVDYQNLILTSTLKNDVPPNEAMYDRRPKLSVDPKLAYKRRDKSALNRINLVFPASNIRSAEIERPATTMFWSFPGTRKFAVLSKKFARDRNVSTTEKSLIHSEMKIKIEEDRFTSSGTTTTTNYNTRVDSGVPDISEAKLPPVDNSHSIDGRPWPRDTYNTTIFENSIGKVTKNGDELAPSSETPATMIPRYEKDFTTSSDVLVTRAKNLPDSSSGFSSENHTKNDAIVLSGSLRNPMGNWLTYDESKKIRKKGGSENSTENYEGKIEFGNKDVAERTSAVFDVVTKKSDRYDARLSTIISHLKPVEIHLETSYDRESSEKVDDERISPEIQFVDEKNSKRWNNPRSYRSIAESDRSFPSNNDRQRIIDKRIEDEFEKISDVLKDAGETPKIMSERPTDAETFEKDSSVMKKFATIFANIPKEIESEDDPLSHENLVEGQTTSLQTVGGELDNPKIKNEASIIERFNRSKIAKISKFGSNSRGNPACDVGIQEFESIDGNVDDRSMTRTITEENRFRVTDREVTPGTIKHGIVIDRFRIVNEYRGIPKQPTGYDDTFPNDTSEAESTTKYFEHPRIAKHKSTSQPIHEIPSTTEHPIIVESDEKNQKHVLPGPQRLTNMSPRTKNNNLIDGAMHKSDIPVLTIQNLKEQLRDEALRYSSFLQSRGTGARTNFQQNVPHWKLTDEKPETITESVALDQVSDFMMEEETFVPNIDDHYPVSSSPTTINFPSPIGASPMELVIPKSNVFPQYPIRSFGRNLPNKKNPMTSKKTNRVFLLFGNDSSAPSASLRRRENGRVHEDRVHRHHRARNNRNVEKSLTKNKRSISTAIAEGSIAKKKIEDEDDEISWYETTTDKGPTVYSKDRGGNATVKMILNAIRITPYDYENRKSRDYNEMPELSNRTERKSRDLVGSDLNAKVTTLEVQSNFNSGTSNFQKSISSNVEYDGEKSKESPKSETTTKRGRKNILPSPRAFASFYPKSSDIIAMSANEGLTDDKGNRRNKSGGSGDSIDSEEKEGEAVIFYDYEDGKVESIDDDVSANSKRSLDKMVPEEIIDGIIPSEGWKEKMELLKLKKHADVLKEYLNWRHDVAAPESRVIPSYTTKTSLMLERPEETAASVSLPVSKTSNPTNLPNAEFTCSKNGGNVSARIDQETEKPVKNSYCQNGITMDSTVLGNVGTSSVTAIITSTTKDDNSKVTNKTELPTPCSNNNYKNDGKMTTESVRSDEEASTGKILPPCDSQNDFPDKNDTPSFDRTSRPKLFQPEKGTSPRGIPVDRGSFNEPPNDLLVISVYGKHVLEKKNVPGRQRNSDTLEKVDGIYDKVQTPLNSRQRRHRSKKKNFIHLSEKREQRAPARRLMSVRLFDESNEDYQEYQRSDNREENNYVDSTNEKNIADGNNFHVEKEGAALNRKWNDVLHKIIHGNSSEASSNKSTTNASLKDTSSDDRSVLKQLHFYDADKYIRKMAMNIVHNGNVQDSNEEKYRELDKIRERGQKSMPLGRGLKQYPGKSAVTAEFGNAGIHKVSKNLSGPEWGLGRNYPSSLGSRSGESGQEEAARDSTILPSGNIHAEERASGQPMSTTFNSSSGVPKTFGSTSNETAISVNGTKIDSEMEHTSKRADNDSYSNESFHQSASEIPDTGPGTSIKNYDRSGAYIQNARIIRKPRSVDPQTAKRYSKFRDDRSYDSEDSGNYGEDLIEDEYDSMYKDNDDSLIILPDQRTFDTVRRSFNDDEDELLDNSKIRSIQIIPLESEKSGVLSPVDSSYEDQQDNEISRMIGPQSSETVDDDASEVPEKSEKSAPVALPGLESLFQAARGKNCGPGSSVPSNFPLDDSKEGSPPDRTIPNNNPMSLRLIGVLNVPLTHKQNDANVNVDPDIGIVPLIHVNIHPQGVDNETPDGNLFTPLNRGNQPEGCPKPETTDSTDAQDDGSVETEGENLIKNLLSPRPNMNSDKGSRGPIGSCPEFNKPDVPVCSSCFDAKQTGGIPPPELPIPCRDDTKTSSRIDTGVSAGDSNSRKNTRMRNMMAILEFMKKINKIMSGGDGTDYSNGDFDDAVIKLERVIILPKNRSGGKVGGLEELETSADRGKQSDKGISPKIPGDNTPSGDNVKLFDTNKLDNRAMSYPDTDSKCSDNESLLGPKTNSMSTDDKPEQSFLFNEERDQPMDSEPSYQEEHYENLFFPERSNLGSVDQTAMAFSASQKSRSSAQQLQQYPELDGSDYSEDMYTEKLWDDEEGTTGEKETHSASLNKRKALDNGLSITEIKRQRSIDRSPSNFENYDVPDVADAGRQVYRKKLFSSMANPANNDASVELTEAGNIPREKRRKMKKKRRRKKKKRRRKKKKKKTKKKKGRNDSEAESRKGWWPFQRQLMSVSKNHHVIPDSKVEWRQIERRKAKKHAIRPIPIALKQRKIRQVHTANRSRRKKKKSKKHRKHKKGKKKKRRKKKKKTKKTKGRKRMTRGRSKRQIKPGGTQARGGQDCMDRRHPSNVNPVKYLESSHCLRFSDMWYSAYELEHPIMEHTVYLQLFEKHSLADGTAHWDDLTRGTMVRIGTFTRYQRDDKPTIVFTYTGAKTASQKMALNLDPATQRLLVPSPVPPKKVSQYTAFRGPGEFLVVRTSTLSKDGKECDKAGVGFAAFAKQHDRCGRSKGACLKNQPLAYWRHDMEARKSGRSGCYFLSNFATVPTNPIKYNVTGTGSHEYLALEYHSVHVSTIDIEVRTDYNAIVRVGSSGRVTEVYVDSTSAEHTVVTMVISNMGLASSPYQPRITDCPTGLPVSWTRANGIMQVIPPQHDRRITLDLYGQLLLNGFHCSVEVINHRGELVAMRRIRVQKMDRCFCVWHCLCACIGSVSGLGCQPMSTEHYHAAGFQGPVPVITAQSSMFMDTVKDVLTLSALLIMLLLFLGLLKWLVGMCAPAVSRWGLSCLLEGSRIDEYFEPELRCRCVVTDEEGTPVHPDTRQRTVRLCSRKLEFLLNLIFFLTYPIAMCCRYFRTSLQSARQRRCCPDESKVCLINEKSSCPKMICVSTYGDSRNSQLEAEDTRYVINELKKSQESLQNPGGTKVGLRVRKRDT